jgi:hypothetical protein
MVQLNAIALPPPYRTVVCPKPGYSLNGADYTTKAQPSRPLTSGCSQFDSSDDDSFGWRFPFTQVKTQWRLAVKEINQYAPSWQ